MFVDRSPCFVFPRNPEFVHSECEGPDPSDGNTHGMTTRQLYKAVILQGLLASNIADTIHDPYQAIRTYVTTSSRLADAMVDEDKAFDKKDEDE